MVSPHNVSKQMEETYRKVQEDLGIQIHPRHVELPSGRSIPITGSHFTNSIHYSVNTGKGLGPSLQFSHPHESGAGVTTYIHQTRGGSYVVRHHSTLGYPPSTKRGGDFPISNPPENVVYSDFYSSQDDIHSGLMEHLSKTDDAIRSRGGVDQELRETVRKDAGIHSGMHHQRSDDHKNIINTGGRFDQYGRFTEGED